MQVQSGGRVAGWDDADVEAALEHLETIESNTQTLVDDNPIMHAEMIQEHRIGDSLLLAQYFMLTVIIGYLISAHFTPTSRQIVGD